MLLNLKKTTKIKMVNNKRAIILPLMILIAFSCISSAFAFSVSEGQSISVCAGTTSTIISTITGSGSYTITSSGSAAPFSTIVPSGLVVNSQGLVYSYITPPSYALPGPYDLVLKISDSQEAKEIKNTVEIKDCHSSVLTVDSAKDSCTCEEATFLLNLKNTGSYLESYNLFVEGTAKDYTTLSDSIVILGPNEEKLIKAYVKAPCDIYGKFDLTFKAKSSTSLSVADATSSVDIKPCYEYSISTPLDYYSLCEHATLAVPLSILNSGTAENKYNIKINAPNWVNLEKNQISVNTGETGNVKIVLEPPYQTIGNFSISTETISVLGEIKKNAQTNLNVKQCYGVLVDIARENDRLCNAVSNKYEVRIKNLGDFENTFDFSVDGADWATLSESSITLDAAEEKILMLDVHPPYNTDAWEYKITVKAKDVISGTEYSDSMKINVASLEQCYQPSINAKQESVELTKDNTATDLIVIENKGTDNATYIIDLSGTASKFSELNPGIVNIAPGKAEVVYLYVAPTLLTSTGDYEAVITARMKDSTILSSKTINIKINEAAEKANEVVVSTETPQKETASGENIFSKIGNWFSTAFSNIGKFFSDIFSVKPKVEIAENITVGELKQKFLDKEISESELKAYLVKTGITEDSANLFIEKWKTEAQPIVAENVTEATTEVVENETAAVEQPAEEVPVEEVVENVTQPVEEVQPTEQPAEEVSITVENQTENATIEELNPEEIKAPQLDFSKYKKYIIGAVILILIMLIFITGLWKKIIEFFEEEVEEPKKNNK